MLTCKICKSTDFVKDVTNANNDLVCQSCGTVAEDNPIVSEVTFGENSSGAAVVQGSYIGKGQTGASMGAHGSSALESRQVTLNNAYRKLRAVSFALHIPEYITDAAHQWYKLALHYNFVQGRRSQNVIASCLYIACRKEKTHHMLIDFSSRLQVSVYSIGATFLRMVKRLHITNLPLADPSLFIQHFAERLDLGDKKIKVAKDAVKLAQRMSRDWMYEGRRPAGIAGACVLLACRMNNMRRTHSEIVAVSHVAEETIQQRLNEFKNTRTGKLSINEFRRDDSPEPGAQPPSFTRNRANEKKIKENLDKDETSEEALNRNPILTQVLGEQELSSREILFYLKRFTERREHVINTLKSTHGIDDSDVLRKKRKRSRRDTEKEEEEDANDVGRAGGEDDDDDEDEDEEEDEEEIGNSQDGNEALQEQSIAWSRKYTGHGRHFQDAIDGYSLERDPYRPLNLHLLPSTQSFLSKVSDDAENLDDVDDEELESHLLDEEASKLKERIWIGINGDYLLEQESKRLKIEADIAAGNTSGKRKRTNRRRKRKTEMDVNQAINTMSSIEDPANLHSALQVAEQKGDFSTADSVKNMLQKASFSKKINYDAIDGLFG